MVVHVSVVIPVLNEAENIGPLIAEIRAALEGRHEHEIVVVDDGSSDATPQRLRALMGDCSQLRVLRHHNTCGQSTAIRSGVGIARGEWIATLDGDGQNDPADIPRLLEAAAAAPDPERLLLAGHRHQRRDSWIKRISSRIANRVRGGLLRDQTPDTGCGLKLFRRELFLSLPYFDHMHRFLPALVIRAGGRVESVPVNHRARERGASKYGTLDRLMVGIVDLAGVLWLIRRSRIPRAEEIPRGESGRADAA